MPIRLRTADASFEAAFSGFLAAKREASEDVIETVRRIVDDVRARGDSALVELSARFDRADLGRLGIRVTQAEIDAAAATADPDVVAALTVARDRIRTAHQRQKPEPEVRWRDDLGTELGHRWTAVQSGSTWRGGSPPIRARFS
jgi:histidinol dehydrogenase